MPETTAPDTRVGEVMMRQAGHAASVQSLGEVALGQLQAHRQALFVLSTCGEGDAPDEALPFMRRALALAPGSSRNGLQVGILALGDRRFTRASAASAEQC